MTKPGVYSPRPPEELALEWIKDARKAVDRLSVKPGEMSFRSGGLSARLLAVKDGLRKVWEDWPLRPRVTGVEDWAPIPPTPGPFEMERAADRLRTLLGHTIDAIDVETSVMSEGTTTTRGRWRENARDGMLAEFQEFARTHPANLLDPAEMFSAGPNSIMAVESGLGQIAVELHDFLRRDDPPLNRPEADETGDAEESRRAE